MDVRNKMSRRDSGKCSVPGHGSKCGITQEIQSNKEEFNRRLAYSTCRFNRT